MSNPFPRVNRRMSYRCEGLEPRTLLSTLVWTNRGSDDFGSFYGGNAATARAIVDRALADWGRVIQDFNYAGGGNSFNLQISAVAFSGSLLGLTDSVVVDGQGKPTSARIRMDDNGAGGNGWYFDPVPGTASVPDDCDFTGTVNPFYATGWGTGVIACDFYNVVLHEIGHAMGIARGGGLTINNYLTNTGVKDPINGTSDLYAFNIGGGAIEATITDRGGGHFYEGAAIAGHPELPTHPDELMNPAVTDSERHLISDLDISTLRDAYGYTVTMPSQVNTFYVNLDITNNRATIEGSDFDDTIVVNTNGTSVQAWVGGTFETMPAADVQTVSVWGHGGNDTLWINALPANTTVDVDGGSGGDTTRIGYADLDSNLPYCNITLNDNWDANDVLYLDDYLDIGWDTYTLTASSFTKSGFGSLSFTGIKQLMLRAGQDQNTILVQSSSAICPVRIDGTNGQDYVAVGTTGSGVKWIQGMITLINSSGANTVVIDDGADSTVDAVVLDDLVTDAWYGRVTGLASAAILWTALNTSSVQVITASATDLVSVRSTVCPTTVSSSGGNDAVTAGDGGSVARIYFNLTLLNPPSYSSLVVDNRSGVWQQTVTLDTVTLSGSPFGRIEGLASASILYKYADLSALTMYTGVYADTVIIAATGVPTTINNGGSTDFVTVGTALRGVQDIAAQITVENDPSYTALTIDDSGDGTARTISVDVSGAYTTITGVAPALIRCDNSDIESLTLRTGSAGDTINILRSTEILLVTSSEGYDVVNVGNATDGVQSITGSLTIQNPPRYTTLTVNDAANTTARAMTLDTVASADGLYGRILWLAPAVISYKVADIYSPITIHNGTGADNIMVNAIPDARSVVINTGGGGDWINVYATGTNSSLYVNAGPGTDTLDINETTAGGPVFIQPSSGDDAVNLNADNSGSVNAVFTDTQRLRTLSIGSGGAGELAAGGSRVLTMASLSIAGTGRLNMTDNSAIVDYSGTSPVNTVRSLLASGYAGGAWNGDGINSSSAAAASNRALGYAEAVDLFSAFPANFAGQSIDGTSVLIRYTVGGDANLSRNVDITDLGILATNWQQSPRRWSQGDLNFDQLIDITDLGILATNWQAFILTSDEAVLKGSWRLATSVIDLIENA